MQFLLWACLIPLGLAQVQTPAPQFFIELQQPPEERFKQVATYFKVEFSWFMETWEETLGRAVPPEQRAEWVNNSNIKQEYQDEIRGFVKEIGNPVVNFENVMLWNLLYELATHQYPSTGVVATDPTGRTVHARTYDLELLYMVQRYWKNIDNLAANLTFTYGGTPLANAPSIAGHFGFHTVMKLYGASRWSFQQNGVYGGADRALNLEALKTGALPLAFYIRELVLQDTSFRDTVLHLSSTAFAAPSYCLLAGSANWEGAAIEVRRNSTDQMQNLNHIQVLSPTVGRWFLVQTTTRVWEPPPEGVMLKPRAIDMLLRLGGPANVTAQNMLMMARTDPLYSPWTLVSTVMVPSTGQVGSLLRKEKAPNLSYFYKKDMSFLFKRKQAKAATSDSTI